MKHFPELAVVQAGGGKMLAPSSGGVFEPHTIHMPYLFPAQCMLTDSVVTRVLHVIMMHDPQPACQVKVAHWTPSAHCAYFANMVAERCSILCLTCSLFAERVELVGESLDEWNSSVVV